MWERVLAITCECDLILDDDTWHFYRKCASCGGWWYALHCEHDRHQNPCNLCGVVPIPNEEGRTR